MKFLVACIVVLTAALMTTNASAQDGTGTLKTVPAEKYAVTPGGVDMRTGQYVYKSTDLSAGPADGGGTLALTRSLEYQVNGHINPFANFSHSWDIMLTQKRINIQQGNYYDGSGQDYQVSIYYGGRAQTFRAGSTSPFSVESKAGWGGLTYSGDRNAGTAIYTYAASDGTQIVFRSPGNSDCSAMIACAFASSILLADGTKYALAYETQSTGTNRARLKTVQSSRGYALLFEYTGANWNLASKACVLNLALAPMPTSGSCPIGAAATVSYGYTSYNGDRLASVIDAVGKTWSYTYATSGTAMAMGFKKPGAGAPWLTNYIDVRPNSEGVAQENVGYQSFADGRSYTYTYNFPPEVDGVPISVAGGSYTDNNGRTSSVVFDFPVTPGTGAGGVCHLYPCTPTNVGMVEFQQTSGPVTVTDPLNRTTKFHYCDLNAEANLPPTYHNRCYVTQLQWMLDPEGIKTYYTWDNVDQNILQIRKVAKSGSGLADVTTSATYDCTHRASCAKPTSTTDAKGNVTTYTYDPTHGGILTETEPAVSVNGAGTSIAAVKRYGYTLRKAWVSNGAGGYTQNTDGVYLLTSEKTCRSTATNLSTDNCAGGAADEVVTAYDYGPDSGPNTLILRGTTVTADVGGTITTLRSCFGYDALGNKISETKPRAGLTVCP